jgi:hypothetical protein
VQQIWYKRAKGKNNFYNAILIIYCSFIILVFIFLSKYLFNSGAGIGISFILLSSFLLMVGLLLFIRLSKDKAAMNKILKGIKQNELWQVEATITNVTRTPSDISICTTDNAMFNIIEVPSSQVYIGNKLAIIYIPYALRIVEVKMIT